MYNQVAYYIRDTYIYATHPKPTDMHTSSILYIIIRSDLAPKGDTSHSPEWLRVSTVSVEGAYLHFRDGVQLNLQVGQNLAVRTLLQILLLCMN